MTSFSLGLPDKLFLTKFNLYLFIYEGLFTFWSFCMFYIPASSVPVCLALGISLMPLFLSFLSLSSSFYLLPLPRSPT